MLDIARVGKGITRKVLEIQFHQAERAPYLAMCAQQDREEERTMVPIWVDDEGKVYMGRAHIGWVSQGTIAGKPTWWTRPISATRDETEHYETRTGAIKRCVWSFMFLHTGSKGEQIVWPAPRFY